MKFKFVKFPFKKMRILCPTHGKQKLKLAWDSHLNAMTGATCEKCPDVLKPERQ